MITKGRITQRKVKKILIIQGWITSVKVVHNKITHSIKPQCWTTFGIITQDNIIQGKITQGKITQ